MQSFTADDRGGRFLNYGVREHAMGSMMNGMAAHRGMRPYGATFLVFSDYERPAMRLAAMMGCRLCSCSPTTDRHWQEWTDPSAG